MISKFKKITTNLAKLVFCKANIVRFLIIFALLGSSTAYAGIETLMKSVMPSGTLSNNSKAALIKDQLGGI